MNVLAKMQKAIPGLSTKTFDFNSHITFNTVNINGPVHFADFGGKGNPMLLVHGLGGAYTNWLAVGENLRKNHKVIAPDLLGFGRTYLEGRHSDLDSNVAMLEELIEQHIKEPVILMGHSMGGLVSLKLAAKRPDLVKELILVSPATWTPYAIPNLRIAATFLLSLRPGFGASIARRIYKHAGAEGTIVEALKHCTNNSELHPEIVKANITLEAERLGAPAPYRGFMESWRSTVLYLAQPHAYENLVKQIKCPTLLLHGTEDKIIAPKSLERLSLLRPDWSYKVMAKAAHMPQLENPVAFCDIVRSWLRAVEHKRSRFHKTTSIEGSKAFLIPG
jgi:pimeloyl-ACP methyl ester carboxylesterase